MYSMLDLTIAIPVKNEERNIVGCLNAIGTGFAKKIVLIDSGSSDNTKELAKANGAEIVEFDWNGMFPKKRNWYLRNHTPQTKWILFLDADEYLTPSFKEEARKAIESADEKTVGYWLNYSIYFMGKVLKGGYPLKKLALFRTGAGEYERIDEDKWSNLDMEIHEHPVLTGNVGVIKSKIDHRDFRGISHYVIKHQEYATWEAERYLKFVKERLAKGNWTWKQRLKYRLMRSVWLGPFFFIGSFFLMGGIKDGARGFAFAIMKMSYFTQIYCKIKEGKD